MSYRRSHRAVLSDRWGCAKSARLALNKVAASAGARRHTATSLVWRLHVRRIAYRRRPRQNDEVDLLVRSGAAELITEPLVLASPVVKSGAP